MRVKERWGAEVLAHLQPAGEAAFGQPPATAGGGSRGASAPPPPLSHLPFFGPDPEVPLAGMPPSRSASRLKRLSSATPPAAKRAVSGSSCRSDSSRPSSRASQGSQQPLFRARRADSDAGRYTGVKTIPSGSFQVLSSLQIGRCSRGCQLGAF